MSVYLEGKELSRGPIDFASFPKATMQPDEKKILGMNIGRVFKNKRTRVS